MQKSNGSLHTSIDNNIATITFGHASANSFPSFLLERLAKEFDQLSEDENVHVIILKSDGDKTFSAGASFDELLEIETPEQGKSFFLGFANVINAMRRCSKLIIGRVQGKAVGGGVGLIATCDYVLATETASVKLSEFTIGIGPFVIAPALERKIGVSALADMTIDATHWKTAYWAKEKGLYARVFDSISDLDNAVEELAEKLTKYNPKALIQMKKVLWENTTDWENLLVKRAEISGELVLSEFTKNTLKNLK